MLQSNRKGFTNEVKAGNKMKYTDSKYFRSKKGILLCMWKDKKAKKLVVVVYIN